MNRDDKLAYREHVNARSSLCSSDSSRTRVVSRDENAAGGRTERRADFMIASMTKIMMVMAMMAVATATVHRRIRPVQINSQPRVSPLLCWPQAKIMRTTHH